MPSRGEYTDVAVVFEDPAGYPFALLVSRELELMLGRAVAHRISAIADPLTRALEFHVSVAPSPVLDSSDVQDYAAALSRTPSASVHTYDKWYHRAHIGEHMGDGVAAAIKEFDKRIRFDHASRVMIMTHAPEPGVGTVLLAERFGKNIIHVKMTAADASASGELGVCDIKLTFIRDPAGVSKYMELQGVTVRYDTALALAGLIAQRALRPLHPALATLIPESSVVSCISPDGTVHTDRL